MKVEVEVAELRARDAEVEEIRTDFEARRIRARHDIAVPIRAGLHVEARETDRLNLRRRAATAASVARGHCAGTCAAIVSNFGLDGRACTHPARTKPAMSAVVNRIAEPAAVPETRRGAAPPDALLDLLVGIVGLWLAAGFLLDSWAHLHVAIETFFTPYHATFYGAMVAGTLILAVFARRNFKLGFTGFAMLPAAYQTALWGVPIFFLGGIGDLIWHTFFGVEDRVEAVTSPTHLIIGVGVLLVVGAPIRSALQQRGLPATLRAQLPMIFALATWLEFIHLGTSYVLDPGAARIFAPPDGITYSPDYFTNTSFVLFKTGAGVAIIILQSLILMGVTLWMATRFALRPGAVTVLFVLGNCMVAAALTNDTWLFFTYLAMSLAGGIAGDLIIAKLHPAPWRPVALGIFGAVVPGVYYAAYFIVTALTGGVWFSWALTLGALVWAMLCGLALTMLAGDRKAAFTTPPRSL